MAPNDQGEGQKTPLKPLGAEANLNPYKNQVKNKALVYIHFARMKRHEGVGIKAREWLQTDRNTPC